MRYAIIALMLLISTAALADPIQPDSHLTPGAWNNPPTPLEVLCTPGHAKLERRVDKSTREKVFRLYGFDPIDIVRGQYEVDHLVPIEIDGTNSVQNLWPESYLTKPWNAHVKDRLENRLHKLVCSHQLDLAVAQQAIATDWVAAYQKYVGSKQRRRRHVQ